MMIRSQLVEGNLHLQVEKPDGRGVSVISRGPVTTKAFCAALRSLAKTVEEAL